MTEQDHRLRAPSLVGTVLGRYALVRLLGEGGMGAVYEATHQELGRRAAVKTLHERYGSEPDARQRFLQEGQAAARIRHSNVADVYDVGIDGEHPYLVMELLDGENLARLIAREAPLSVQHTADLLVPVVAAVAAAHDQGVVHRDLKPENIFLCADRQGLRPKVLDFGISKLSDTEPGLALTGTGVVLGTPHYMSPEQAQGAQDIDGRSDQYSLGVVLYECVTGCRPMQDAPLYALLHRTVQGDFPPPRQLLPGLPGAFEALILQAMARRPGSRFPTTRALGAALLEYASERMASDYAAELAGERPRSALAAAGPSRLVRAGGEQPTETAPESPDSTLCARSDAATLVGRQQELARLEGFLEAAARGSGRVVFLTGEAGIGKTALSDQFLRQAGTRSERWIVTTGRCLEHFGTAEAYLPFLEAVGALLAGDDAEFVAATFETHAPTWCLQFPAVFGAPGTHERLKRATEGATRERMLRELAAALVAMAAKVPVLLRLEDLHWADPASIDVLRLLCQRVRHERVLVIGTFRPDQTDLENAPLKALKREMQARNQCEELTLGHLSDRHLQDYLDRELSPNDFPLELATLIVQKTEGNALFATRVIQSLVERNSIVRGGERWSLVRPPAELEIEVPESVSGMIQKKLESLPDEDWKTLQYASIEGVEFTSVVLARLLDVDEMALEDRLRHLARTHRLLEALGEETLPEGSISVRYRFAHVLYQNVLYQQVTGKRRASLHLRAAAELVALYREEAPRIATRIARHFEHGHDSARASEYWIHAGNNAARLYTHAEAEKCYSHAFRLLADARTADESLRSSASHQKAAWAEVPASEFNRVAASLIQVIEQAQRHGNDALEDAALQALSHLFQYATSRLGESETHAHEGLRVAAASAHGGVQLLASAQLASKQVALGQIAEAQGMLSPLLVRARALGLEPALRTGLGLQGICHFIRTEHELATKCFAEALSFAMSLEERFSSVGGLHLLGKSRSELGLISDGLATLQEGLRRAKDSAYHGGVTRISATLEWIHRELDATPPLLLPYSGDQDTAPERSDPTRSASKIDQASADCCVLEAETNSVLRFGSGFPLRPASETIQVARRNLEVWTESSGSWHWYAKLQLQAAKCQHELTLGQFAAAEQRAHALLDTAGQNRARKYMAIAHRQIAEVRAERGDHHGALEELQTALELLREYPTPLVTWKLHAGLARLYQHLGEPVSARQSYAQAAEIVHAIAAHVGEEKLRSAFLNSPLVHEVCGPSAGPRGE